VVDSGGGDTLAVHEPRTGSAQAVNRRRMGRARAVRATVSLSSKQPTSAGDVQSAQTLLEESRAVQT